MSTQKAFVYTELQISIPFDQVPWRELTPTLKAQPGLICKTWLSGDKNQSVGGIYEFDSLENARKFATTTSPAKPASSARRLPRASLMEVWLKRPAGH